MSETGEYDSVRVSTDGVRVLKRFAADEFPVPAIAFDISSGRDESVTLRLSDDVPDEVSVEDLGFHPDYGSEHWTIEEDRITFEREFEPNATYTTVYGIRAADDVTPFLAEPTIEAVDPPLAKDTGTDSDIVLESDDALVEDAIAGEVDTSETEEETTDDPDPPSTLDLDVDDRDPAEESDDLADSADESTDDGTGDLAVEADSLVAALAAELRENEVPQADIELLREVLAEEDETDDASTVARLEQLQQDIADLRAYANALEAFLDENGTAEQLISGFEDDIDAFQGEIAAFEERIEHLETEFVVEVRGRIDDLEEEFDDIESRVTERLERVDELGDRVDDVAERADDADARTTELVGRVDDMDDRVGDAVEQVEGIDERVEAVEEEARDAADRAGDAVERAADATERADDIDDRLDDIAEQVDDVDERTADLEADVESLRQWKEQITQTFGS